MKKTIVNSNNFNEQLNNVIEQLQTFNDTQAKKAAIPEMLRAQQEGLFNSIQQIIAFAISVNNDTNLVQVANIFNTFDGARKILNFFKFAIRRQSKTGELKRTDYAKRDAKSAAQAVLDEPNPFSQEYLDAQKEQKRLDKEAAPLSAKLTKVEKGVINLQKTVSSLGLSSYAQQLEALLLAIQSEKEHANQAEIQELKEMPSIAAQSIKAA